ncbi:hypothetical protein VII00023_04058 [Vibrio ichthyoenteri ATCC 700023]|uniref:Uncharacterized protein n=1 Tax=Vibrio ichthyoenteri ATCC 700023 TaxID=870968 RepID=F9S092_9VIBR|nr:hypothetical protein VII00023_04058 [Vibrio ichthyoenteri ATCC 700023]
MFQIVRPATFEIKSQNKASDLLTEGRAILAKHSKADKRKLTKKHKFRIKRLKN